MLAGGDAAVAQHVGVGDKRRHRRIFGRLVLGNRAPIRRIKLLGVAESDVVQRRSVTGQAVVCGRVVILHSVVHRPNLCARRPVDHHREPRQMLAHAQARLAGRDRLELAANPVRRIGLHVERVQVGRAAELVQEDDVLGARPMELGPCSARSKDGRHRPAIPAEPSSEQAAA